MPVFFLFSSWGLLSSLGAFLVLRFFPPAYPSAYVVVTAVDAILELGVLVELAWAVIRPLRLSLPRSSIVAVGFAVLAVGALIWPLAGLHGFGDLPAKMRIPAQIHETSAIMRVLFFLVLAGSSQLLSIGWRDRELQIATGLGFYSLVSLATEIVGTHLSMAREYRHLNQIVWASSICSLVYWVFCFSKEAAKRQAFTPQMEHFLLALAGSAKTARVALDDSSLERTVRRKEP
jgi:hypothetical protein